MKGLYEEILEQLQQIPVVDTHEHLPYSDEVRDRNTDVLKEYLLHYMNSDIISAGMDLTEMEKVVDTSIAILERWALVEPYWEFCRYTGYGRALDISVRKIYGIDGIRMDTIEELNDAFMKSLAPGHFHHVLKDMCNIRVALLDGFLGRFECDKELFRRVWRPDDFIKPCDGELINRLEKEYSIKLCSLDDWLEAFDKELEDALANGVVALKCGLAYSRSLYFKKLDYKTAYSIFGKALGKWKKDETLNFPVELQDFMMHYILKKADEKNHTFQFHTGLQAGNGNMLANSNPLLLNNLFLEYPNVNFDIFHIGYPFHEVASALCKNFPNVFIDMCWAHIISPAASMHALDDFLDAVPYNKISAFGGDYRLVDGIYGHLYMARQNVSRVLARKVEHGVFSLEKAIDIAQALFHDNPMRIFKLDGLV